MRCYLGPLVLVGVAGVALGVTIHLLLSAVAGPPLEPVPPVASEATAPAVAAVPAAEAGAPAQAAAAVATPDARALAAHRLREAVFEPFRGVQGRFGIAVKDLASGLAVQLNESFPFQAASLYKLPVMYETFKLRESGLLTFREELTIGPEDAAMDLGTLSWPVGTRITIGTALERMVTISDNSSAFMLTRKVGSWRINEDAISLGMRQTYIRGDDLSTSALDMVRLLELIATGQAVDAPSSAEMVHLMARQQVRNRIPQLLPAEATVANKTGNWEGAAHDVAIVYTPRSTLVMAFLSDGVSDHDAVYEAMARAARNVYEVVNDSSFDTRPDPPLPPGVYGSYAAAPRLPIATAVPTRPAVQTVPPATPIQQRPPANTQPNVVAPQPAPAQQESAPSQAAPATPTAAIAVTPERRDDARPGGAPKPAAPKPEAPKPAAPKPEGQPAQPTPAPLLPSVPSLLNPANTGGPSNAPATPTARPQ